MFTVRVLRPGRESRTSLHTFIDAMAFASEVIVMNRGEYLEVSIVDEERREEVQNYYSDRKVWVSNA